MGNYPCNMKNNDDKKKSVIHDLKSANNIHWARNSIQIEEPKKKFENNIWTEIVIYIFILTAQSTDIVPIFCLFPVFIPFIIF